jgi:hypothetical protein
MSRFPREKLGENFTLSQFDRQKSTGRAAQADPKGGEQIGILMRSTITKLGLGALLHFDMACAIAGDYVAGIGHRNTFRKERRAGKKNGEIPCFANR